MKNIISLFFLLFFCPIAIFSQQIVKGLPNYVLFSGGFVKTPQKIIQYQPHKGFLVNNKRDTLIGEFLFSQNFSQEAVLYKKGAEDSYEKLSLKDVYFIYLEGADSLLNNKKPYTEFFKFNDISTKDWLRKIASKNGVSLYDNSLYVNEINGFINTTYVVLENKEGKRKQFPNFWNANTKRAMIRFYNQSTGEKISYNSFKDKDDFIKFLLN